MTLEQYLKTNCERQVTDHSIRAEIGTDGNPRFYIHPANVSGETLDFVVTKNQLHPAYVWDGLQQLADANPIPPDIRAKMDADRAETEKTPDEEMGMKWWNGMCETERAEVLRQAHEIIPNPSAADAWKLWRTNRIRMEPLNAAGERPGPKDA